MTGDAIKLIEKLNNNTNLQNIELYELYTKVNTVFSPVELLKLIGEVDDKIYDFEFLMQSARELGVKRKDINELLLGLCELAGDNLESITKENSFICKPVETCPFKSEYVLYSYSPREEHAQLDLNRSEYNYLKLGDCRKDDSEWYHLYTFELLEDDKI